jgi:hypothetical protein
VGLIMFNVFSRIKSAPGMPPPATRVLPTHEQ